MGSGASNDEKIDEEADKSKIPNRLCANDLVLLSNEYNQNLTNKIVNNIMTLCVAEASKGVGKLEIPGELDTRVIDILKEKDLLILVFSIPTPINTPVTSMNGPGSSLDTEYNKLTIIYWCLKTYLQTLQSNKEKILYIYEKNK